MEAVEGVSPVWRKGGTMQDECGVVGRLFMIRESEDQSKLRSTFLLGGTPNQQRSIQFPPDPNAWGLDRGSRR